EEPADRGGVEILEAELGWLLPAGPGDIGEEQPEAVPVGRDRVRAGLPLADQALGEVLLQRRGDRAHDRVPGGASSRSAASASSSGDADRYQLFRRRNNWYYSDFRVIPIPAPLRA